jgi:hypothetical protein
MASTINATTNGIVNIGDSVATLALQTGGTTAVAIDTAQIVSLSKSLALLGSTSGSVALAAPAVAGTQSYTLPTAVPAVSGYALTSTTAGVMSWAAGGGSAATPTALGTVYGSTNQTSTSTAYNTVIGYNAGVNVLTGGAANIILGESAAGNKTSGNQCIYMGYSSGSSATVNVEMVINASGNTPVGKGSATGYLVAGNTPGGIYQGNNSASWSTTSDQRLKKNIADNNVGLEAINYVRVRNFEYRLPEEVEELAPECAIAKAGVQLGVIAQELQAVLPDCVKQESTGVLSVDSDNLTWHMVNAIKQLSTALDAANARIATLEAK